MARKRLRNKRSGRGSRGRRHGDTDLRKSGRQPSARLLLVIGLAFLPFALLADTAAGLSTVSEYRHGCGIRIHLLATFWAVTFSFVVVFALVSWWKHRTPEKPSAALPPPKESS